jgi:hypothetical protein
LLLGLETVSQCIDVTSDGPTVLRWLRDIGLKWVHETVYAACRTASLILLYWSVFMAPSNVGVHCSDLLGFVIMFHS